jgi:ubiquinone/menaquinone biosynthesis C-methylase UbiE
MKIYNSTDINIRWNRGLKVLRQINKFRMESLKRHIAAGNKIFLELGCGDGEFAAKLSQRTGSWVVGIDEGTFPMFESEKFTLDGYQQSN